MLGEQIGEEKGKVTARRVISIDVGTKVEVSFQSSGKLLGVEHQSTRIPCIFPDDQGI